MRNSDMILTMGKGWFIARLAIDYGLLPPQNIYFGTPESKKSRESAYKRAKNMYYPILKKIVDNWNNRIRLEGSSLSNKDLYDLAIALLKKLLPPSLINSGASKVEQTQDIEIYDSYHERDHDAHLVRYDSTVPEDERVEGLTGFLDDVYERIRSYAREIIIGYNFDAYFSFEPIPVILKQGHPTHTYKTDNATLAKLIFALKDDNPNQYSSDRILSILNKSIVKLNIAGEYCGRGDKYIVLYYENTSAENRKDLFLQLEMTLAHEYMHYIHNMFIGNRMFYCKSANTNNVIEAIADFFSAMYMGCGVVDVEHGKFAQQRLHFWNKYYGFSIPYVYALDFLKGEGHYLSTWPSVLPSYVLRKFLEVIRISKSGMEEAFKLLIS